MSATNENPKNLDDSDGCVNYIGCAIILFTTFLTPVSCIFTSCDLDSDSSTSTANSNYETNSDSETDSIAAKVTSAVTSVITASQTPVVTPPETPTATETDSVPEPKTSETPEKTYITYDEIARTRANIPVECKCRIIQVDLNSGDSTEGRLLLAPDYKEEVWFWYTFQEGEERFLKDDVLIIKGTTTSPVTVSGPIGLRVFFGTRSLPAINITSFERVEHPIP
ncbi:MAG: hypothetical protein Q4C70_14535 [Planctomycetia bacterium]|nr:hypothetical protein [Planctomycetia bacterium]